MRWSNISAGSAFPPCKCLFDNDTTNIVRAAKPEFYDPKTMTPESFESGGDFTDAMIEASIDETVGAGVDVHKLSPVQERNRLNWMRPDVRRHFLTFADELCAYDIDGFELDFTRHASLFRQDQTTRLQREDSVTAFVADIHRLLDRHAREGRRRWLCITDGDEVGFAPERNGAGIYSGRKRIVR